MSTATAADTESGFGRRPRRSSSQGGCMLLSTRRLGVLSLLTALGFLDQKPDLSRKVEVTRAELKGGGHTRLRNREIVSLGDLFHMSLMCSDNVATRVLARESGLTPDDFLASMNRKAFELG